jgi:glutamyl-tRNA reductase
MRSRREKSIFLIDIAVPRDIEPEVADLNNVYLYNIDDLQTLVLQSMEERKREIEKVHEIVDEEVEKFIAWTKSLEVVPLIRLLREKVDAIKEGEWERTRGKLSHLSDQDTQAIEVMLQSLVNKIMHYPMLQLKDYATDPSGEEKIDIVRELFGLELDDINGAAAKQTTSKREAKI